MTLQGRGWLARRFVAAVVAVALAVLLPAIVAAHPLGNFTINHFAGLRVAADRVSLDVVIDQAEIPTFQERTRIDTNGDGTLSAAEIETERVAACPRLASDLTLVVGSSGATLTPTGAGLSFPLGASGIETTRLVCAFEAALASPVSAPTSLRFEDRSWADRIGWREIVVQGNGTTIGSTLPTDSVSGRLTNYPTDLLSQPLDVRAATVTVRPGGPVLAPWSAPEVTPLRSSMAGTAPAAPVASPVPAAASVAAAPAPAVAPAAVPGGVAREISGLLGASDLTPIVLALSFLTAVLLGAGHALTPGHGKTIMAAYLVGTKGTARHALGLGLATAVSHTIGVLLLALLIVVAGSALPADRVYPILTAVSGVIVVAIGVWLLATQVTRRLRPSRRLPVATTAEGTHLHPHAHQHDPHEASADPESGLHRHGRRVHGHTPADASGKPSLGWRSLFALGLSGGLVPSTNALLILVATVAAGRPAYGVVLVVAFGLGMAAVLVGVGLALVYASGLLPRAPGSPTIGRLVALAPILAAVAVLGLGIYLTAQAFGGSIVL